MRRALTVLVVGLAALLSLAVPAAAGPATALCRYDAGRGGRAAGHGEEEDQQTGRHTSAGQHGWQPRETRRRSVTKITRPCDPDTR